MDPAVKDNRAEDGPDPASDFVQWILSNLPNRGGDEKSRLDQRRWYDSLSEEGQMQVRDRLREEISRVRAQFGKRSNTAHAHPVHIRDYG
jgi:hypothetical protein